MIGAARGYKVTLCLPKNAGVEAQSGFLITARNH